jgi:hypothetical protein
MNVLQRQRREPLTVMDGHRIAEVAIWERSDTMPTRHEDLVVRNEAGARKGDRSCYVGDAGREYWQDRQANRDGSQILLLIRLTPCLAAGASTARTDLLKRVVRPKAT